MRRPYLGDVSGEEARKEKGQSIAGRKVSICTLSKAGRASQGREKVSVARIEDTVSEWERQVR